MIRLGGRLEGSRVEVPGLLHLWRVLGHQGTPGVQLQGQQAGQEEEEGGEQGQGVQLHDVFTCG